MTSLPGFLAGITSAIIAVLFLAGILPIAFSAIGKGGSFSLGTTLENFGNDLANSIIGMVKQKANQGCDGIGGSTSTVTSSSSSKSGSSSMMTATSDNGGGQTVVSSSGEGKTTVCGGPGDDVLNGGSGSDILYGGKGNDKLFGNNGNDILIGGPGADHFDCGPGNDTVKDFNPSEGDTKTQDCENVMIVHDNGQATFLNSQTHSSPQAEKATANKPEKITRNATNANAINPQTPILKRNPIVPANSAAKKEKPTHLILAPKIGSMRSLTVLALNKSKITNETQTTSAIVKNTTYHQGMNLSRSITPSNDNATSAGTIAQATIRPYSNRPILILSGESSPASQFRPSVLNVKTGQQILWLNPSSVPDPHTVTFVLDNKSAVSLIVPLLVSNSTQFKTVTPGENGMPILRRGAGNATTLLTLNSRAIEPVVIDHNGFATKISQKNSTGFYKFLGTEQYVNSGWLLPKEQEKGYPGALTSFEVSFTRPGVYKYADIFHPWMKGTIIVN